MLKGQSLLDYTNLFSPNKYEKDDKITFRFFEWISKKVKMKKIYCIVCGKYRKFKNPKISCNKIKKQSFPLFAVSVTVKIKNI